MGTVCPYQLFSVGEYRPLIFECSKRALDFGGGRCYHYHFIEMLAQCFGISKAQNELLILLRVFATRTTNENVVWTKTIHTTPIPIKGSK